MKKIISVLLIMAMLLTITACNNNTSEKINCSNCGENISRDADVCEFCGAEVVATDNSSEESSSDEASSQGGPSSTASTNSSSTGKPSGNNSSTGTQTSSPSGNGTSDQQSSSSETSSPSDSGDNDTPSSDNSSQDTSSSTSSNDTEPTVDTGLPRIGNIYITTRQTAPEEYTNATIRADWEGAELSSTTVQIKLRGNTSAEVDKKSYNIKFSKKTSFMGMGQGRKWSLLANPFDKSLLRISLAFDYAKNIGLPFVSDHRVCNLWVNNKFMGVYIAMEPITDSEERVDIDVTKGDAVFECDDEREEEGSVYLTTDVLGLRFQINEPENPTSAQVKQFKTFWDEASRAVKSLNHEEYEKYIDVESFVNLYIFEEVVKDIDFNRFSTRYVLKDGKLYAGPPWDLDLSMGNVSREFDQDNYYRYHNRKGMGNRSGDSTQGLWAQTRFYEWLCKDPYFMNLVKARWEELKPITENLITENSLGMSQIDRYLETYEDAYRSNFSRYGGAGWSITDPGCLYCDQSLSVNYTGNVNELRTWLEDRIAWLDKQFS